MMLDGALAVPIWLLLLLLEWEAVPFVFLMVSSLVAIAGGALAARGIMPLLAGAGPALLILASVVLMTVGPLLVIVAIIGMTLAVISLGLVLFGWSDLVERARARERALGAVGWT